MRKLVFISLLVILSLVFTSCSIRSNNKSEKNLYNLDISTDSPNMIVSTIATVSPTIAPSTATKAASPTINTTTTKYIQKTPADYTI